MAKFDAKTFEFTGTFGKISVYRMRGIERPIVRTKGGATREKIKKSPKFALTRLHNQEFGEAAYSAASIRLALLYVRHLCDYNFTPKLNGLCREIMKLDNSKDLGYRQVIFSTNRHLLEGFSLNKQHIFDSVLRHPLQCSIDRDTCSATVQIPVLSPGFSLSLPWLLPMYRIIVSLGILYDGGGITGGSDELAYKYAYADPACTPWLIASQQQEATTLTVAALTPRELNTSASLVVSVGIEMGTIAPGGETKPVRYTGCAKILMIG